MEQIAVILQNLESAMSYSSKFFIFDENGGDIGSDNGAAFYCQDTGELIKPKHARINYEEGFFTISPYENCEIFYNDSFSKLAEDYQTVINKGDIFRIGELKLIFVEPSKINEYMSQAQKLIENTPNFDKLDDIHLEPRGKITNPDFKETPNIDLFPKDDEVQPSDQQWTQPSVSEIKQNLLTSQSTQDLLQTIMQNLEVSIQPNPVDKDSQTITARDLEAIIKTIPLVNSTALINTVLVKLICKELYTNMYDIVENNSFFKYLSGAVTASTKEDKRAFEYLILKALQSYSSKK